jgi:hypothetical protein
VIQRPVRKRSGHPLTLEFHIREKADLLSWRSTVGSADFRRAKIAT